MAEGKKSFVAYSDWKEIFDELPDEDAGKLIKHIFAYVNDEHPESDSVLIRAVFAQIKATLKRDLKKWESQIEQRREAGKRSAELRAMKSNERSTTVNERSSSYNETQRNSTDSVSVSVSVSDSVNEKKTTTDIFLCSISDEIELSLSLHQKIAFAFWRMFRQNVINSGIKPTTIDKAKLEDWTRHVRLAFEQDGRTADQFKFIGEFLKRSDFWKKNIRSTDKLRAQFERLYIEAMDKVGKDDPLFELKQKLYAKYHTKE